MTLLDKLDETPRVEPVKRMVGGRYGWAYHRFPIKGGISPKAIVGKTYAELLARDMAKRGFWETVYNPIKFTGRESPLVIIDDPAFADDWRDHVRIAE